MSLKLIPISAIIPILCMANAPETRITTNDPPTEEIILPDVGTAFACGALWGIFALTNQSPAYGPRAAECLAARKAAKDDGFDLPIPKDLTK